MRIERVHVSLLALPSALLALAATADERRLDTRDVVEARPTTRWMARGPGKQAMPPGVVAVAAKIPEFVCRIEYGDEHLPGAHYGGACHVVATGDEALIRSEASCEVLTASSPLGWRPSTAKETEPPPGALHVDGSGTRHHICRARLGDPDTKSGQQTLHLGRVEGRRCLYVEAGKSLRQTTEFDYLVPTGLRTAEPAELDP